MTATKRYLLIRRSTGKFVTSVHTRAEARTKNQNNNYGLRIYDAVNGSFVR